MRHRKKVNKLGRTSSHRKATLRNIASALIEHHQIRTTLAKAKAAQSYIENLISYGKNDTVHSRRLAFKLLQNRTLVKMLFDDIATTFNDRKGGYTRVVKLGKRRGDGAPLAILQLVGFEKLIVDEETPKKKKGKGKTTKKEATKETVRKKADKVAAEEEAAAEVTTEQAEETVETEAEKKPKKVKAKAKAKAKETKAPAETEEAEAPETTEAEETKAAKKEKAEPKKGKKKASKKETAEEEGDSETGEEKK